MPDGGKGSKPRPFSVDMQTFDSNWDAIFNKNKEEKSTATVKEDDQDIDKIEENNGC